MNGAILLCLVIAVSGISANTVQLSKAQKEKVKQYSAECITQSGVKPEVVIEAKKGNLANDPGLKKFIHCFFQKTGIVGADGKVNTDIALSKLPAGVDKASAAKVLEDCKKKTGKDAADTIFEIFKCYHRNTKTHIAL